MTEQLLSHAQIDRIVYAATLAPSPHNAQGWKFRFTGRDIEVWRDTRRKLLRELDPEEKEGTIALGAAVENLVLAAAQEGLTAQVAWCPFGEKHAVAARVTLGPVAPTPAAKAEPKPEAETSGLGRWIEHRTVNRSNYKLQSIPPSVLVELQGLASREGFELSIVTDPRSIRELAGMAGEAGRFKFTHEPTHRELYEYLRFTADHAAASRDGLPLEKFFIPPPVARLGKYAMRWGFLKAFRPFGYHRALAYTQETARVAGAPALCLLTARSGRRTDYLQGGRLLQRIALTATKHGLAMQPHSAIADLLYARAGGYHDSITAEWRQTIDRFPDKLRELFGLKGELHIVNLFRLGYPCQTQETRSLRRNLDEVLEFADRDADAGDAVEAGGVAAATGANGAVGGFMPDYEQLTARNYPFIDETDQFKLRRGRIAVAGCGSIGGASLEVLVRMGAERFVLAEPDTFELNNLNRQNATLGDIGQNKAEALLRRLKQINPGVRGYVLSDGITAHNVHYVVGSCEVIIDGVDITEPAALQAKILLHREAWRQQRPVISGYDIAGTQLIRVYDYRTGKLRPLDGKFDDLGDGSDIKPLQFLSRVISPLDLPAEMLPVTEAMIRGTAGSIPQLGPTAQLFGVLSSWAALDLLAGRPVRKRTLVDIPGLLRPSRGAVARELKRLWGIVKLKRLLEQKKSAAAKELKRHSTSV